MSSAAFRGSSPDSTVGASAPSNGPNTPGWERPERVVRIDEALAKARDGL